MSYKNLIELQSLESRRLLSGTAVSIDGVLVVNGDPGVNDTIKIEMVDGGDSINVDIDGTPSTFAKGRLTSIVVNLFSGNDTLVVNEKVAAIPCKITCYAGDGNDSLTGGSES